MGILDYFKRTGKPITSENIEAKIGEVAASIVAKEGEIAKMREELPARVLDDDNLAVHRIEHEEREVHAFKIAKAELEAKLVEVRESEAIAELEAQCDVADEKLRKCEEAARAFVEAFETIIPAAKALFKAHADFAAADFNGHTRGWAVDRNIAESFCDLVACEIYLRLEDVPLTPRVNELLGPYRPPEPQPRATIESFMKRLRGCAEAMRHGVQYRREHRSSSKNAA